MCIRDRAAYAEESFYVGADPLDALVSIKSKNEVIADIVAWLLSLIHIYVLYLSMSSWDARCENMSMCGMKLFRFARMLFLSGRMEKPSCVSL